jgi:hypothetical protein
MIQSFFGVLGRVYPSLYPPREPRPSVFVRAMGEPWGSRGGVVGMPIGVGAPITPHMCAHVCTYVCKNAFLKIVKKHCEFPFRITLWRVQMEQKSGFGPPGPALWGSGEPVGDHLGSVWGRLGWSWGSSCDILTSSWVILGSFGGNLKPRKARRNAR